MLTILLCIINQTSLKITSHDLLWDLLKDDWLGSTDLLTYLQTLHQVWLVPTLALIGIVHYQAHVCWIVIILQVLLEGVLSLLNIHWITIIKRRNLNFMILLLLYSILLNIIGIQISNICTRSIDVLGLLKSYSMKLRIFIWWFNANIYI